MSESDPYSRLSAAAGREWPALEAARARAGDFRIRLENAISPLINPEDLSVVVFGSLARGELTSGSDTDWTLLLDGQASPDQTSVMRDVTNAIAGLERKEPGREATFGVLASSHELLHNIGGGADTNRNLTQRILLLLESAAVGPGEVRARVVSGVLSRYISEDPGWENKSVLVPRFLLNDISRYWRTVAVDFAYKRRERNSEGWAIRTVKLRLSRKLTFASGLLACFSCALEPSLRDEGDRSLRVIEHLTGVLALTPLERTAALLVDAGLGDAAARIFDAYGEFLEMMDDPRFARSWRRSFPSRRNRTSPSGGAGRWGTVSRRRWTECSSIRRVPSRS